MNYGLYLSASGVLTSVHRKNVLANNLANVETVGFKPDLVTNRQRLPERQEAGLPADPQRLLERMGGGLRLDATRVDLSQGALDATGNPLDLAIDGDGFFTVGRPDDPRHTRDGRFTIDASGRLVTSAGGLPVLDADGREIRLTGAGPIDVDGSGAVRQGGVEVARLKLVSVDETQLVKVGANLYRTRGAGPDRPATGALRQGFVETSAVDPILTLNALIGATKAAQANAKLMQYHDFIMGQAISTFGRVA